MEASETAALLGMYDNLRSSFTSQKQRLVHKSILLGLVAMGSKNKRMRVLLDAAVRSAALGSLSSELMRRGLVEQASLDGRIALSARGIWEAEQIRGILDLEVLLEYVDEKWFRCFVDIQDPVTDKERLLLFVLLSARAFSADTGVNLQSKVVFRAWTDSVVAAARFLIDHGVTGDAGAEAELLAGGARAGLQPLLGFWRYSADLPKKTEGIFVAKSLNYFLNLDATGKIEEATLAWLFALVLGDRVDFELADVVYRHCRERAYELAAKVRPAGSAGFATFEVDQTMEAALRRCALRT